jgi:tetratricopeptide (TPR) repeat protein
LDEQGHPDAAACWARLRTLVAARDYSHPDDPAVGPLARLRADLLADEANKAGEKDEFAEAAALHDEAAGLYDDAGAPGDAALARAAVLLATAEIPAEGADEPEAKAAALTTAHASMVRLHEETPGLTPHQEARLLRLRATALALRLQTTRSEEHVAPVFAEADLLSAFATRHDIAGQISGARLLRATTYALSGDLPAAVTETDALLDRLKAQGPAWHLPRTLGLRGRLQLVLQDPEAAYGDLAEGLRLAADWPAETVGATRLHADLAEACMRLGRPDEALRHLTRSAELDLRGGNRTDAYCTYSNAAQLSLDLGRVEDCIALLDSLLAEPDVAAGELDDRLVAQLRLTRARALHAGEDLKAATAEFVALASESAGWDDDPGSHAMIAAETAVLLAESGEFGRAREAADQALAAHARDPRYELLSNSLREIARLQAQRQGPDGLPDALALLADAGRIADEARAAGYEAHGRSLDTALAYEHGRVNAYAGAYEDALAALEKALALLGEPGREDDRVGEWAECVRLAGAVEGLYLERRAPALTRLDAAITRLTALGHTGETESLVSLAGRLRDEE